jgi:N-acetylneuraminic acid mutarotase
VGLDNKIYAFGGYIAQTPLFIYDKTSDTWTIGTPLPDGRGHITGAAVDGTVYAFGGLDISKNVHADVLAYDPDQGIWETKTPMPSPRAAQVTVAFGAKIYNFGGVDSDHRNTNTNFVYDPSTDTWDTLAPMPTRRHHAAGAVIDSLIFVVGGRIHTGEWDNFTSITNFSTNEAYAPSSDTWYTFADIPLALSGHAAAALNGKVYAFGGEYFLSNQGVFEESWEYDPVSDSWKSILPMPTPRHGTGAVTLGQTIHIVGGGTTAGAGGSSKVNEGLTVVIAEE